MHRDLKPENLLLTSPNDDADLKIIDFGFTQVDLTLKTRCGSPDYIVPEILRKAYYGAPVDMWTVGVIVYTMLGVTPRLTLRAIIGCRLVPSWICSKASRRAPPSSTASTGGLSVMRRRTSFAGCLK